MDGSQICSASKKRGTLSPKRGRPKGTLQGYPSKLRQEIYALRDQNIAWGAISILVELEARFGYNKNKLPSADDVHRYLAQCGFIKSKAPKGNLPNGTLPLVGNFHDLWEMDVQGAVAVEKLGYICMINIKDLTNRQNLKTEKKFKSSNSFD